MSKFLKWLGLTIMYFVKMVIFIIGVVGAFSLSIITLLAIGWIGLLIQNIFHVTRAEAMMTVLFLAILLVIAGGVAFIKIILSSDDESKK